MSLTPIPIYQCPSDAFVSTFWLDTSNGNQHKLMSYAAVTGNDEWSEVNPLSGMNGKKLEWDGPNLKFTNNNEANHYLHYEYRKGWTL